MCFILQHSSTPQSTGTIIPVIQGQSRHQTRRTMTTPGTLSMSHSVTQACTPQTSVPYTADDPTIIRLLFCFFSAKLPHTRRLFPATEYTKIPRLVSLPPVLLRICPAVPVTSERKLYKWNSCDRTTGIFYNFSPSVPRQSLKRPRRL